MGATINNESTPEPAPYNRQQPKPLEADPNAFHWHQIFSLDSPAVTKTQNCLARMEAS